ncbi:O-antigen ligase family protein [Flavobacterium sp.]|uniref:O-antigen ligase family protein n=1 Tax=Flavobacterium sp. TaxID=239 RepID=UPI00286D80DD|nr:O-antigen ligase family protein [Flavobacterium sp.]
MIELQKDGDQQNNAYLLFYKIVNDRLLYLSTLAIILSYFYNLPIVKYSIIGDNEFRLYDIVGVFLLMFHFKYNVILKGVLAKIQIFRWFWNLFKWASTTLIITLFVSIYNDKIMFFVQTLLYLFHLYVFFISGVFVYILCLKKKRGEKYITWLFQLSIVTSLVVIFQNFELIPFLWSDSYKKSYSGFLSGTLGPNKIVLGMTFLYIFIFSTSVVLERRIKVNFFLTAFTILLSFYALVISGSRTSYVGFFVFIGFFAYHSFGKFLSYLLVFASLFFVVLLINDKLYETAERVIDGRVIKKVKNIDDFENANVGNLYEDLGSGRKSLSKRNAYFLLENPIVLPFGMGFNNRLIVVAGDTAHNMYLQVIKELGLVGFFLYFGWLLQYLLVNLKVSRGFSIGLKGLIISVLVTAFFGEQLYIYRALFGLLGLFCVITSLYISVLHKEYFD